MTRTEKTRQRGSAWRAGKHFRETADIVALPSAPRTGSIEWRKVRGLLTWRDHVALNPSASYACPVSANSLARIGVRQTRCITRAARCVFSCPINGGLCAGDSRPAGPSPGTPTAYDPPPFIGVKGDGLSTLTRRPTMTKYTPSAPTRHIDTPNLTERLGLGRGGEEVRHD